MHVDQWGSTRKITVFGRESYSRTAISQRLQMLCREIREEMENPQFSLNIVADTLQAIGIFTTEQIETITQLNLETALFNRLEEL